MTHDHSKSTTVRQRTGTRFAGKFILYVEGRNTEKSYFDLLKRANCTIEPITVRGSGINRCTRFVSEASNAFSHLPAKERNKYKQKWLIFDYDGRDDFAEAIKTARTNGFHVAYSSMCIEYWFLLHFENHDGKPVPICGQSHSEAQIRLINKHIQNCNKTAKYKVALYDSAQKLVSEDFFDLLMAIDPVTHESRALTAMKRAMAIHATKVSKGSEFSESVTTVYELLQALGVFVESKYGWYLFRR